MTKLIILPYNANAHPIDRARTSVPLGSPVDVLVAKINWAVVRAGTSTRTVDVINGETGEVVSTWDVRRDGLAQSDGPGSETFKLYERNTNMNDVNPNPADTTEANGTAVVDETAPAKGKGGKKAAGKKAAAEGGTTEAKRPGVIAAIKDIIGRDDGASIKELTDELTKRFPDRDSKGMTSTARIQANRHAARKATLEGRGLVYYGKPA